MLIKKSLLKSKTPPAVTVGQVSWIILHTENDKIVSKVSSVTAHELKETHMLFDCVCIYSERLWGTRVKFLSMKQLTLKSYKTDLEGLKQIQFRLFPPATYIKSKHRKKMPDFIASFETVVISVGLHSKWHLLQKKKKTRLFFAT